jgi:hypothetical protein
MVRDKKKMTIPDPEETSDKKCLRVAEFPRSLVKKLLFSYAESGAAYDQNGKQGECSAYDRNGKECLELKKGREELRKS